MKMSKHIKWGFSGSSVIQNPPANAGGCGFNSWVRMILWRRKWQPTPVFLPGKSHGQRTLVGYVPWAHKEPDTTEQLTLQQDRGAVCPPQTPQGQHEASLPRLLGGLGSSWHPSTAFSFKPSHHNLRFRTARSPLKEKVIQPLHGSVG